MNEVCRARPSRPSTSTAASRVKICRSGQNRIRVPERPLGTRPPLRVSPERASKAAAGPSVSKTPGTPRQKLRPCRLGGRSTSTSMRAESALTTERPTPCRPPVALYEPPPNLPPACSFVATTSTPGRPVLGSLSVGMPRPSSCTSTESSRCRVTSTRCASPARASSTPLSMISHRQCINPRVSVEPMYMPGLFRTASRPSRTSRCAALYVLSIVGSRVGRWTGVCSERTQDTPGDAGGTLAPGLAAADYADARRQSARHDVDTIRSSGPDASRASLMMRQPAPDDAVRRGRATGPR